MAKAASPKNGPSRKATAVSIESHAADVKKVADSAPAAPATSPASPASPPSGGPEAHGAIPVLTPGAHNPYLPYVATVREVIKETHNIMTFRVTLDDEEVWNSFHFEPGQVGQLSLFGAGEATFVINSPPTRMDYLQFSVMRAGEVTAALHGLRAGDKVGVRAPLGNHFPYNDMKGKDIVLIGGGIGMAPIRTLLYYLLDNRKDYGTITLLYGARSPQDMAYSYELPDWLSREDLDCVLTIDREAEGWEHRVGLIPNVLLEMNPSPKNAVAVCCGPPIMIKFTMEALAKLNFAPEQVITTLERRMKCGIGICGRCNIGEKYVCVDGPVFTSAELKALPNEL
ncbi:FAD/NAD(P)-binding protein [Desulfovibrio sp. OttesenSCG-928-I05]|nr:FAD/NAD(P)-binding protein [Desulfovibrio sp. OttesenSCG-928-I05]